MELEEMGVSMIVSFSWLSHWNQDPTLSASVARQLAQLHKFKVPPELEHVHSKPGLWNQIWLWLDQAKQGIDKLQV